MTDYSATAHVAAPAQRLFDYLSDIANLPTYFSQMTSARPGDGEAVYTTASLPDGREVEGEAWFRVDRDAKTLAWGSEGPSNYQGTLSVTGEGDSASVEVTISTERGEGEHVQNGVEETVANIKRLVENS